ncbi:MAG TPA: ATP-dependent DNA ligase [Acidimicrobiia bacterium]|jgi:DNA ligase-1|nr:ATP-dependent DNA ligase [Acidimicrobiia bacterium]
MLLADVVATSASVASTRSRNAKIAALAELLAQLRDAGDEVEIAVGLLTGVPRQGRIGVGWATIGSIPIGDVATPSITLRELDDTVVAVGETAGAGSEAARRERLSRLLGRATESEAEFVRALFTGGLRQGALEGLMLDAIARAADVDGATVRRAAMRSGDLGATARVALEGGVDALNAVQFEVLRPVLPMLAGSAPSVEAALAETGPSSVEWKLDGARVQVHRSASEVRIFTRNLNDVTERLPEVVESVLAFSSTEFVLDGEAIGVADDDRPHRFQDTMSRFGTADTEDLPGGTALRAFFFDCLRADGVDLLDAPLSDRRAVLERVAAGCVIPSIVTSDPTAAEAFLAESLAAGHEGVMVKALTSTYEAGRRGKAWRKVKPVRTLDLVVLAAEWGHGRRQGWLSNLHLGARDPSTTGRFVMVGKTFKGLTDALLTWQTEKFQELATEQEGIVVYVRPELVVEIALDGVQRSTRYPGGVALRFARVRGYRPDKSPADADTIDAVRALLP